MNQKSARRINKFLNSNLFSAIILAILVIAVGAVAYFVTDSLQPKPDFGGMVTIRQAQMDIETDDEKEVVLTRSIIYDYLTSKEILAPIAERCGWHDKFENMAKRIDVRERLASPNSFIIMAHTGEPTRSIKVARALAIKFLEDYKQKWTVRSCKSLMRNTQDIENTEKELQELKSLRQKFQNRNELRPLNTEIEMKALNEQLVEAQNKFLEAYGAYVNRIEEKRQELQLELDVAMQVYAAEDVEIRIMKRKLKALELKCIKIQKQLAEQKPNLYRMTTEPQKLVGLPYDIIYFFDNVQNLQQIKLALMLDSIIEEKVKTLEQEKERGRTLNRLLNSNSCDVFIREIGK